MGYVEPTTRATGYLVTAANWNQDVVANVSFLANPPACRVYHNTSQNLTNNTRTALDFNSERYDTDTMHSTVTNSTRITFTTAGVYVVGGQIELPADTDLTAIDWSLRVNGSAFIAFDQDNNPGTANVSRGYSIQTQWKFAAADYVEFMVRQVNTSAGAATVIFNASYSPDFYAVWVGRG